MRVRLTYRLDGTSTTTDREQYLTVVPRGGRWLLAGDTDASENGFDTQRDLWDLGPVRVVRGDRGLVLADARGADRSQVRRLAEEADQAVEDVDRLWRRDWAHGAVVLLPRTQKAMATLIGSDGEGLPQIAAVTTGSFEDGLAQGRPHRHQPLGVRHPRAARAPGRARPRDDPRGDPRLERPAGADLALGGLRRLRRLRREPRAPVDRRGRRARRRAGRQGAPAPARAGRLRRGRGRRGRRLRGCVDRGQDDRRALRREQARPALRGDGRQRGPGLAGGDPRRPGRRSQSS